MINLESCLQNCFLYYISQFVGTFVSTRKGSAEWIENGSVVKKNECGQKKMSVLSVSVSVECGVWSVECDSAVSGEPPKKS